MLKKKKENIYKIKNDMKKEVTNVIGPATKSGFSKTSENCSGLRLTEDTASEKTSSQIISYSLNYNNGACNKYDDISKNEKFIPICALKSEKKRKTCMNEYSSHTKNQTDLKYGKYKNFYYNYLNFDLNFEMEEAEVMVMDTTNK